nr:hypothetical protein [Vicinamibacterales bacterium]
MKIPNLILRQLYTFGSLASTPAGARFALKNRLSDATVTRVARVAIDGVEADLAQVALVVDGQALAAAGVSRQAPVEFPLRKAIHVELQGVVLGPGKHQVSIAVEADPFGELSLSVEDSIAHAAPPTDALPYDKEQNQSPEIIGARQAFVEQKTGVRLRHVAHYSIDPSTTRGNVENFTGVAQVPIGVAGPLRVNGEHAQGEFFVPMATTEG